MNNVKGDGKQCENLPISSWAVHFFIDHLVFCRAFYASKHSENLEKFEIGSPLQNEKRIGRNRNDEVFTGSPGFISFNSSALLQPIRGTGKPESSNFHLTYMFFFGAQCPSLFQKVHFFVSRKK